MSKRIGILGCGWLGTPLAKSLLEKSYEVRGTTTRDEKRYSLEEQGIKAYRLYVSETGVEGPAASFLKGLDCLVVDFPPGLRKQPDRDFVSKIRHLEKAVRKAAVPRLLFVSSTSVFGSGQGKVTEDTLPIPDSDSGQQMLQAETLLLSATERQTLALRLGGLLGPDRHPVRFLSGREIPNGGLWPVNLIRLGDAVAALNHLIAYPAASGVYHAVCPAYPSRRDYYDAEARALGIPPPVFRDSSEATSGKQVLSEKLQKEGFRFTHSIFSEG